MKTKKINYRNRSTQIGRQNGLKLRLLGYAYAVSGFARIPIENIIRSKFGLRYFSFSSTILTLLFFGMVPFMVADFSHNPFQSYESPSFWQVIWDNLLLYIYLGVVFYFSLKRRKEIKELPSVYDFAMYSKCNGYINRKFLDIKFQGRFVTIREIETFWEPATFFAAGLLLALLGQSLGYLLIFCSVVYSLGYCAAYHYGDNNMMDIIDDTIIQEELMGVIVEGKEKEQSRGYSFMGNVPNGEDNRRRAANKMRGDDEFEDVN
ncbi:hypothetical protein BEL04_18165 [Mucilaginibacter sp. PPCGB 2223]|uniref:hypothetical protein n=1 Tax=Mucilaginibacter sp. PPCGB 2223 TaxID=1886027 RepID=UPI0008244990|nr:hypothetical protein [Mucilaginibacter sp. PPCGB 2223]OCX51927.1 hypothetical protein BEL04_18165 [Mucilaginibacter sp. PPCGB 2223]